MAWDLADSIVLMRICSCLWIAFGLAKIILPIFGLHIYAGKWTII